MGYSKAINGPRGWRQLTECLFQIRDRTCPPLNGIAQSENSPCQTEPGNLARFPQKGYRPRKGSAWNEAAESLPCRSPRGRRAPIIFYDPARYFFANARYNC